MRKSFLFLCALALASLFASAGNAEAHAVRRGPFSGYCAWSKDVSVCDARKYCVSEGPTSPRCAKYCLANRRDVVCGEVYQPTLPRVYPGYGSPYPWANPGTGGFCQENPYNIACQQNWPWWHGRGYWR